jgi:hypothetical protein
MREPSQGNIGETSEAEAAEAGSTWFDRMNGYLKWKVIGPDIHNPFKPPPALSVLSRMANNREFLCQHISVRCTCDGYEVMRISNPNIPRIESDHPCITTTPIDEIIFYLQRHHLDEFIETELNRLQSEIKNYLAERKATLELEQQAKRAESRGRLLPVEQEKDKKKVPENKTGSRNYRIIKR